MGEAEIREGIRRIGAVIADQVELYEALTGQQGQDSRPASAAGDNAADRAAADPDQGGDVVPFRRSGQGGA